MSENESPEKQTEELTVQSEQENADELLEEELCADEDEDELMLDIIVKLFFAVFLPFIYEELLECRYAPGLLGGTGRFEGTLLRIEKTALPLCFRGR